MAARGGSPGRTQGYAGTWPPRTAAQAGGFAPSGFGAWSSFIERLRAWIRAEAGAGRLLPWVPVAFGTGIAFYFAADREPVASVTAVAATASSPVVLGFNLPESERQRLTSRARIKRAYPRYQYEWTGAQRAAGPPGRSSPGCG